MTWPQGAVPFAVDELVASARALDAAAARGERVDVRVAYELVTTLSAYVDGLPDDVRAATSRRLVAEMQKPVGYRATVAPRGAVARETRAGSRG